MRSATAPCPAPNSRRSPARPGPPGRDELAYAGRPELYGPDGAIYYAASQHVVLYLERRGRLDAYYRTVRGNLALRGAALATEIDWRRFVRWAQRLREGHRPPAP